MTIALPDVVSLVTGAAGGIGREVCKALKAAGAAVVATDLAADGAGIDCDLYLQHDVTSEADWRTVEAAIQDRWGRLDALVHNAGLSIVSSFEATPIAEWRRLQSINVESIVVGTQVLLPLLKDGGKARRSGASVVNFSSVGGQRGAPFNSTYCTTKAAVRMLSKCMGAEFAALGYNIRVNSVPPAASTPR